MSFLDQISNDLNTILYAMLQEAAGPVSEYELIHKLIENAGLIKEPESIFRDPLLLFRTHFILFHALYKLQDQLALDQQQYLSVNPLGIQLLSLQETGRQAISEQDPLREYYLDIKNLQNTSEGDVIELLESFWKKLLYSDRRQEALAILELADPVSQEEIRLQYRRLVMKYHPDRGGDNEKIQELNQAIEILNKA